MEGLFVTFEGPDGSGKTSVIEAVLKEIEKITQREVLHTREPGGSVISENIRKIILDTDHTEMDARTEALLYAASRRQHITEIIRPALSKGKLVLCDRFVDSSLVYQGYARGIGIDEVRQLNHFATEGLIPELTIYLDIDAEEGLRRIQENRKETQYDRLDQEELVFHEKVREGYHKIYREADERVQVIDASQPLEQVIDSVMKIIQSFLQERDEGA